MKLHEHQGKDLLKKYGIRKVYLSVGYKAEQIKAYFKDGKKTAKQKLNLDKKILFVFIFGALIGIVSIKIIDFQRLKHKKFRARKIKTGK